MDNSSFPCWVDIRTPEQLRKRTLRLFQIESSPDYRDDLCALARHYHTAALFGLDADAYFEEIEPCASPYMAKLVRNFRTRPADQKAMDKWALYIADSPQGKYVEYRPAVVTSSPKSQPRSIWRMLGFRR